MTIADTVKQLIVDSGLSDYRVGQLAGIHPQIIGRFLKGERDIRLETADKIIEALGGRITCYV